MNENTNVIEPALLTLEQACNYLCIGKTNGLMIKPGLKRGITK